MEKERPFHKWASDETNFFCEISCEQFYGNFRERETALKKHSAVNYLILLLQNLKKVWKTFSSMKKIKTLKQKRKKPNWWSRL